MSDYNTPRTRMPLKQVAKLQILPTHVKTLVPYEPLQFGRRDAAVHAGGERAAFEAVATKVMPPEAGRHRARLDDLRHGLRGDCVAADTRQGRGLARSHGSWMR